MTHTPHVAADDRYATMQYRRTGKSGLKLPGVSLGLWHNFGGANNADTMRETIRTAFDLGVTHYDLANNYGPPPGSAEENFGRIFQQDLAPYRDEILISTKAGYDMWPGPYGEWGSRKYMLASLDQSLKRMQVDYVDIFYSHRFDPETPLEETIGALDTAIRSGRALYAGISNYGPEQTREAARIARELGTPILINQFPYSMFERTPEKGLLDTLEAEGLGSIVFSPLAQGLLTDRYLNGIPEGSRVTHSHFLQSKQLSPTYVERAQALNAIAQERGQTLAQLAVQWVLRGDRVTSALVGASSAKQLRDTVASLDFPALTATEIEAVEPFAVHGTQHA
ncbi:aldo/keto reductase [Demequina sp. B12]|uniref:aldo/keto reductase n=1 Tax=Demequina sp. B12 TaxID=2992757 RepID=UPI00237ADA24|nr:aldo/keto reductase [Demequina sp. B12]MDE0572244.1 aldo/keto reductase [Demequina sp. B12]